MKFKADMDNTDNRRIYKLLKREQDLSCTRCQPNRGENRKTIRKHGRTKPKHKDKRA